MITYPERYFKAQWWGFESAHLKDRHTEGVNICAPRGEPPPIFTSETESFGVHYLRRHPSDRASHFAVIGSTSSN